MTPVPHSGQLSASSLESEVRYRQVLAHLPVVVYSVRFREPGRQPRSADVSAEVVLVSAASQRLLGCPFQELLGDYGRWLEHVHPDDREVLRAAIVQVGRQRLPVVCEYRPVQPENRERRLGVPEDRDPRVRWVRDTLVPHFEGDGQLLGWEGLVADITEQRMLADDLRRTTNMLHALIGNLPTGVFFVQGPLGQPILVNARARELLGRREDLAASLEHLAEVYRLHRPDGSNYPIEELPVFQALRKGLTAMRDDIVVHHPDGRRIPLVSWAAPVLLGPRAACGASGPVDAAVWVLEDLTALHEAEAARRDTEGRLRTILETMAEGLLVQDHTGRIIECNAASSAILGHHPEQLRGMTLAERDWILLREDSTPLPPGEYPGARARRLGRPIRNEVVGIHRGHLAPGARPLRTEDVRWILVNAMPFARGVTRETPADVGAVITYVDITSSLQVQERLRDSQEKYRELVESLPVMVIQADADLRVTYTNPATRSITGYEIGEIAAPDTWGALIHPEDLPLVLTLSHDALKGRGGRDEFRYRAKDGSEKIGLAFVAPVRRVDGAIVGTTTMIVDMTRERQLEQDLLRAQRLELVGRISSGIAHDFNNLLTIVLSLTELVRSGLPPGHDGHADLARIREATEQAANLAAQLLAFSKQRPVVARLIDVNQVVCRTLDLLRASLPSRIELKAELAEQDLLIQADETQVQQVLMNLCLNARDAMPEGGRLQIHTAFVAGAAGAVRLSVRDQGTGISGEARAHLFDPFFSTKEHGTGLGLAVVKRIVESHGGRVEVLSESGQGTRFDVLWPYSRDDKAQ
jgi:PAS domain S-box-containing protein